MKWKAVDCTYEQMNLYGAFCVSWWTCSNENIGSYEGFVSMNTLWNEWWIVAVFVHLWLCWCGVWYLCDDCCMCMPCCLPMERTVCLNAWSSSWTIVPSGPFYLAHGLTIMWQGTCVATFLNIYLFWIYSKTIFKKDKTYVLNTYSKKINIQKIYNGIFFEYRRICRSTRFALFNNSDCTLKLFSDSTVSPRRLN